MDTALDLSIPITLELGEPLDSLLGLDEMRPFREGLAADIAQILRRYALPGRPVVRVRRSKSQRAVRLRLHGRLQPYPPQWMSRLWVSLARRELHLLPEMKEQSEVVGFPDFWLKVYAYHLTQIENPQPGQELLLEFLRQLVLEIVQERPSCLLGPAQAQAYLQTASEEAEQKFELDVQSEVLPLLQALLELWLPLYDSAWILQALQRRREAAHAVEDVVEAVFVRLRRPHIEIHLHPDYLKQLLPHVSIRQRISVFDPRLGREVGELARAMADRIYYNLGLRLPDVFLVPSLWVAPQAFQVKINERMRPPLAGLALDEVMVNATVEYLQEQNISGRLARKPTNQERVAIVTAADQEKITALDETIYTWSPLAYLFFAVLAEITQVADKLLGLEEVAYEIAQIDQDFPDLVQSVLEQYSLEAITRVMRGLVKEGVSVQNLPKILERLLLYDSVRAETGERLVLDERLPLPQWADPQAEQSWESHLAFVRAGLNHQMIQKWRRDFPSLPVYLLSQNTEKRLLAILREVKRGEKGLAAYDTWLENLRDALWSEITASKFESEALQFPILTLSELRLPLRRWLEAEFPDLPLISYYELPFLEKVVVVARL
jgi:flagellar biosynthesis component FlhA